MAKVYFTISIDSAAAFLNALRTRSHKSILAGGAVRAKELEAEAKRDAPWTDRTGMARATLEGINTFTEDGNRYCIGVCGNQPYSPELENGHGRRYAILLPVMRRHYNDLLDEIRDIISRQEGLN